MSLNTDLQTLKTNIEGVKSTLYTNLTNKGVTNIAETDTLSTLADKVATITVGEGGSGGSGIDFSPIGYDAELSAELNEKWNDDVAYSKTLYDAWNPNNTSANRLYRDNTKLVYAPNIDTSKVTDMDLMFQGCTNLQVVPKYNTSNVTGMTQMFQKCTSLTSVPLLNTSNVITMQSMFYDCPSLTSVPLFNTSQVTYMLSMFDGCSSLTSVPALDTSKVYNMQYMFRGCTNLTSVPAFDTSNVTNTYSMFERCSSLTTVPEFDTSKVSNMNTMFYNCSSLTTIEGISFKSFTASTMNAYYIVGYSRNNSIRKAVFKDIGYQSNAKQFNTSYITNWGVNSDEIPDARQSLIDSLITYSFDRFSAGYPSCTITLSTDTKALLTEDEIAQITAKGFTIA